MKTKWVAIISILLAVAVLGLGLILEPQFPEEMATHWGIGGQADDYGSHFVGIWLIPIVVISFTGLMLLIPIIDPLRKNIAKFRNEYNVFVLLFGVFFVYIQILTLIWNLGKYFNMGAYIMPAVGVFIFYAGILIGKARRNYFVGIRTPWTLQDERVWNETHQIGSKVFKTSGLLALLGILFPSQIFWFLIIPISIGTIFVVGYSYVLYTRYHLVNNE